MRLLSTSPSAAHPASPPPKIVQVSPEEKAAGVLSWKNLELANRALHHDGLVVLENAIEHSKLDFLNEKMVADARILQVAEDSPYNYNRGNIQQDPPLVRKFFDRDIFLNPLATQVTSSVLGPRPRLSFLSGNSAMPPTAEIEPQSQPTHSDADFAHPGSPFALVVNVPLVDMTVENGSTEVWLGTHALTSKEAQEGEHGERASGRIRKEVLEERRKVRGGLQPVVKKGSIVLRDLRLNAMSINFSEDLRADIEKHGSDLQVQATFSPEEEVLATYLKGKYGNAYYFDQKDRLDVDF
ncbi:hypothetical protein ACLOAV_007166 [Pseudogymnoascus australis]